MPRLHPVISRRCLEIFEDKWKVRFYGCVMLLISLSISCPLAFSPMNQIGLPSVGTIDYSLSPAMLRVENGTIRNNCGPVLLVGVHYGGIDCGIRDVWSYADEHSTLIKEYGFNIVRLPFSWNSMENSSNKDEFSYDYSYMTAFLSAVRIFTSKKLYVIIDDHTVETAEDTSNLSNFLSVNASNFRFEGDFFADTTTSSASEHLKRLWLELTGLKLSDGYCLRDDPYIAGYDILNEPHDSILTESGTADERQELHERWYEMQDYIISSMRQTGDSHIFFCEETPWAGTAIFMNRTLEEKNVVYTLHFYRGLDLTTQSVVNSTIDYLRTQFLGSWGLCNKRQMFPNTPFMITEFGNLYDNLEGDEKEVWIQNALQLFKEGELGGWIWFMMGSTSNGHMWSKGTFVQDLQKSLAQ
jgi:hypothetical protein